MWSGVEKHSAGSQFQPRTKGPALWKIYRHEPRGGPGGIKRFRNTCYVLALQTLISVFIRLLCNLSSFMIGLSQASLVRRLNTCVLFTCLVKSSKHSYFQRFQCLCHLVAINRRALLIPIYNLHFRPSLLALEGNMCLKNTLSKVAPYGYKSISTCVCGGFFCKLMERKLLFCHSFIRKQKFMSVYASHPIIQLTFL